MPARQDDLRARSSIYDGSCKGMELVIEVDTPARALRTRKHAREDDKSPRTYATPATKKSRVDDEV